MILLYDPPIAEDFIFPVNMIVIMSAMSLDMAERRHREDKKINEQHLFISFEIIS